MEFSNEALVVGALISIGLGLVSCFFGYRLFKIFLAVWGFIFFAFLTAGAASNIFGAGQLISIIAGVIGGLIGSVLIVAIYFVGLFVFGAWVGSLIGITLSALLNLESGSLFEIALIIIVAIVGGLITVAVQKALIVTATALGGAWGIVSGVLFFMGNGPGSISIFPSAATLRTLDTPALYLGVLLAWLVLAILGIITQFTVTARTVPESSTRTEGSVHPT